MIYIKVEDEPIWGKIIDKPTFLHAALQRLAKEWEDQPVQPKPASNPWYPTV